MTSEGGVSMPYTNKKVLEEQVDSLNEQVSTEKARLRWRLARMDDEEEEPPKAPRRRRSGKLYQVFKACLGD